MISLPTLRRVLFYLFVVAFLILCPLLIMHVLGYDLKIGAERAIVATGDLYVASFPAGARVFVDEKDYSVPTPTSVLDLKPGTHKLTLWADGYLPRTLSLTIEAGKTAVVNDVLLLPEHWPTRELDPQTFSDLLPLSEYPYLFLRRGPLLRELFLFELTRKELKPVATPGSPEALARTVSIVPMMHSSVLLVEAELGSSRRRFVLRVQSGGVTTEDVTELVPSGIGTLRWAAARPRDLFYFRDGRVTRVDVAARKVYPPYPYRVRGFGVQGSTLYLLSEEGALLTQGYDEASPTTLAGYRGVDSMANDAGFVGLTALPNDTLILHGDNGDLLVSSRQDALSIPDVNGYRADTGLLRLLVWQDGRVGVVDLAGGATAGGNAESSLRVDWVATQGTRVEQAFFVLEGTHLLYRESRRVFLVGPDREGERETVPVGEVLPGTSVFYSDEDGALYFIDALTRRPSRLAMVERTQTVERLLLDLRARVPR